MVVEKTENDTIRLIRGYDITASESEQAKTYYHYASDEQGSTTHIFENQELRNRYEYDAFGNAVVSKEQVSNRFKYTGQQHDPITQQYYLRARFYKPVIARFTQEDVYRGDGLNLYAYCDNNPVIYFDPSGYAVCPRKEAFFKELRNKIDPDTGQPYTAKKAYDLANSKWSKIPEAQREYIAKNIIDYQNKTGGKMNHEYVNKLTETISNNPDANINIHQYNKSGLNYISVVGPEKQLHLQIAQITPNAIGSGSATNNASRNLAQNILGLPFDDAGHGIGKNLGGPGGKNSDNIFAQNSTANRGQYNQFEQRISNHVKGSNQNVNIMIEYNYNNSPTRPDFINYNTDIYNIQSQGNMTQYFNNPQ